LTSKQILSEDDPQKEYKLAQHVMQHPNERLPILDTATSLTGKPRITQRLSEPFIPVGHISLDFYNPDPSLADPSKGIFYISTFYVSRALQGGGLGRAAMDAIEQMAIEPPLNAKVLALDTLAREQALDDDFWKDEDLNWQRPKVSYESSRRNRGVSC
jgi:GNAT superfamily N-acetyltransferase